MGNCDDRDFGPFGAIDHPKRKVGSDPSATRCAELGSGFREGADTFHDALNLKSEGRTQSMLGPLVELHRLGKLDLGLRQETRANHPRRRRLRILAKTSSP